MQYISLVDRISEKQRTFGDVIWVHAGALGVYFVARNVIFRWFDNKIEPIVFAEIESFWALSVANGNLYLKDNNTDIKTAETPTGIDYVFINGVLALDQGRIDTKAAPGVVI